MTAKQRFLRVTNLLFLVLVAVQFLPDQIKKDPETAYVLWFAVGVEVLVLAASALIKKQEGLTLFLDIATDASCWQHWLPSRSACLLDGMPGWATRQRISPNS